jgi:radical SAM superfamily enzyme YgiQ (UPF0313 family)
MNHALILTGASFSYPEDYHITEVPVRGTGAHRIASHMRETGEWDIEVLDFVDAWTIEELKDFVDSRVSSSTKWIGFSVFFTYSPFSELTIVTKHNAIAKYVKEKYPWIKTVVGANKLVNVVRHRHMDYYSIGNGEHAITALCEYFVGRNPEPIVKVMTNPLDLIDMHGVKFNIIDCFKDYPAYPHKNPKTSYEERDFIKSHEVLTMELSRGCIFKCTFCDYAPLGVKGDNSREVGNFKEELVENYEKWGVTHYCLADETANASSGYISKFADAVRTLPFQPQFHGFIRGDLFVRRKQQDWDNMIDMGFTSHSMGLETFNHAAGKSIHKGFSPLQLQEGLLQGEEYFRSNVLPGNHYTCTISMIAGLPHETFESLDDTERWLNKYWQNQITMHPLYISQHVTNGIDAVSEIERDPAKYGYTYREMSHYDKAFMRFADHNGEFAFEGYSQWEALSIKEKYGLIDVEGTTKEILKDRAVETKSLLWVHPSGDYDYIDMVEWAAKFQNNRVIELNRPESQSGWHMGWYKQHGYTDLREVYNGNPPIITSSDVDRYYDFIDNYKKDKMNWYK